MPTLTASALHARAVSGGPAVGDIATDHLDGEAALTHSLDPSSTPSEWPVRGVDDDHVHTGVGEQFGVFGSGADADRSADQQAAVPIHGCIGMLMDCRSMS